MGKYVLAYQGGSMADTEAEQERSDDPVDGLVRLLGRIGRGCRQSIRALLDGRFRLGVSDGGRSALTGYSIISADSLASACDKAKGGPCSAAVGRSGSTRRLRLADQHNRTGSSRSRPQLEER
jgi:hypothetical protein